MPLSVCHRVEENGCAAMEARVRLVLPLFQQRLRPWLMANGRTFLFVLLSPPSQFFVFESIPRFSVRLQIWLAPLWLGLLANLLTRACPMSPI